MAISVRHHEKSHYAVYYEVSFILVFTSTVLFVYMIFISHETPSGAIKFETVYLIAHIAVLGNKFATNIGII